MSEFLPGQYSADDLEAMRRMVSEGGPVLPQPDDDEHNAELIDDDGEKAAPMWLAAFRWVIDHLL